ncbi:uncharacterized protein At3g17950-like [Gastrolobium bilobum]|uniref:uncharacterized protein At3g17950-like n=1 Tax=Gastrolobium bilobum TaxID=150636 RepID=UPI002AAFF4CD|nr:uncharacterized protein At3g17950-like [Gastrolobium bilobum]
MSQQVEGWPLGLQPLNARIGMARKRKNSGSMSFNTLLSGSPSSSTDSSSSNLDTQSTESFFQDNSITFGSLIGVSSILELSRRSLRRAKTQVLKSKKSNPSSWLLCLCLRSRDPHAENNPSSLGQFLALERKTANKNRKNQTPLHDEFPLTQTIAEPNSLFVSGSIAPHRSISSRENIGTQRENRASGHGNNWFGSLAEIFSCLCGQATRG